MPNIKVNCDNHDTCKTKVAWYKANDNDISIYKDTVEINLRKIDYDPNLLRCKDVTCVQHNDMLQILYEDVLNVCIHSAEECIPMTKIGSEKDQCIQGWNDYVAEYHQEALCWHYWWKVVGRPHQDHTSEMRRITRARYHRVRKLIQKDNESIRKEKVAEAMSKNGTRDLYSEVRNMTAGKRTNLISVDGLTDDNDLYHLFSKKMITSYIIVYHTILMTLIR